MEDLGAAWIAAMRAGRFDDAWAVSDRVLALRDPATRDDPSLPYHLRWVWDGRPFDGRHVLVRCYHGLGDTIQNVRFLPALAQRCASVTLEVQPRLLPLFSHLQDVVRLHPFDVARPLPASECDLEIMEVPHALRAHPHQAPAPYLRPPADGQPIDAIALCYAAGDWDKSRNVPAHLFERICAERPTISLVSEPTILPVLNPEGCPFDLASTARLICSVRLVITVDTMVAHLAGALGRPTFLLLKQEPDWRWEPSARFTPWYGSTIVLNQRRAPDWRPVVQQLEQELASFDRR